MSNNNRGENAKHLDIWVEFKNSCSYVLVDLTIVIVIFTFEICLWDIDNCF